MNLTRRTATLALIIALTAGAADAQSGTAGDPKSAAAVGPAVAGSYFAQQQVSLTQCTQISSTPSYWSCRGLGTSQSASKALLVTHFNCRGYANGSPSKVEVFLGRGNSSANLTDFMLYPTTLTFTDAASKHYAVDASIEYLVPPGQSIGFETNVIGTSVSSVYMACTYTGRFMTM